MKAIPQLFPRYEFWPAPIFYLPLIPYLLYQSVRSGGFGVITAANPVIPGGGIVGESKIQILSLVPPQFCMPTYILNEEEDRHAQLDSIHRNGRLVFPLIMKPDVSQGGASVRIIYSLEQMHQYIDITPGSLLIQDYHPGPEEVGVFYMRDPDGPQGEIFSITGKVFPRVIGDGKSNLRRLIESHPRYFYQKKVFFQRFSKQLDTVIGKDEPFSLSQVGNHCQGTLFCDRSDLITPELTEQFDLIAKSMQGFYFGRFDVRFTTEDQLRRGENFRIIEANGVTAESTNLYDPDYSIITAYQILFRQWYKLFEIGRKNQKNGVPAYSMLRIAREALRYYKKSSFTGQSD
jgi:hypothetical protein